MDDDPALLLAYSRILEKAGHEVVQAASGEEALRTCEREEPALVLLDANLPSGDERPLVLIVEDDPDAAALLGETLEGAGWRTRHAVSGSVGLHGPCSRT